MDGVKSFGGILLVVGALYFLRPIFPFLQSLASPHIGFLLGAILVTILGIGLGAVHLSFSGSALQSARKGLGVLLTVVGLTSVVNWYFVPDSVVGWRYSEADTYSEAKASDRWVVVDFGAEWCAPCKELEKIFAQEDIFAEITEHLIPLKFDVTDATDEQLALMDKYKAGELPAVIFLREAGQEVTRYNNKAPDRESFVQTLCSVIGQKQASE